MDFVARAREVLNAEPDTFRVNDVICSLKHDRLFGFSVWTYHVTVGDVNQLPNDGYTLAGVTRRKLRGHYVNIAIHYCGLNEAPGELTKQELTGIANRVVRYCMSSAFDGRGLFDDDK